MSIPKPGDIAATDINGGNHIVGIVERVPNSEDLNGNPLFRCGSGHHTVLRRPWELRAIEPVDEPSSAKTVDEPFGEPAVPGILFDRSEQYE